MDDWYLRCNVYCGSALWLDFHHSEGIELTSLAEEMTVTMCGDVDGCRDANGGDVDLACGAVEQAHAQPRFQLLNELRNGGLAHVQGGCRLGEAAGFHHSGKGLHCIETVHFTPHSGLDSLDSTNSHDQSCLFIPVGHLFTVAPS
ncbi:hypothetical protein J2W17_001058 [Pseudomonas lini]|nr:hypothetical protein [Pseudomonas lini]